MFTKALFKKSPQHSTSSLNLIMTSVALFCLSLSACSFVDTQPGSELVVMSSQTEKCTKLGSTKVSVLGTIAGFDRDKEVMSDELITMARNAAFEQGGNTIQPSTEIVDGVQSFEIFRCR